MVALARLLGRALVVAGAGVVAGLATNALRADGLPLERFATATSCVAPAVSPVQRLPPVEAFRLCGDQGVLVADARPAQRYAAGHVAGAIHLPCAASGLEADQALAALRGKHTVVVYGDSTDEAGPVAEDLRRRLTA